ncbi:unnamed protein product [Tilletia controversa]|uniref:Uncharacterized protein n=3 Tax=Tilletia TaxID=13289 RepID=A0A8X7MNL3_9BASI|nr:hypothetical protein CF336_g4996 [Tilletia laevis]KAE8191997.1 hypothetical protein CF328_g5515 [Tilletia controversa]KAE8256654.1 hypothetical protein A4X03_0g5190 [Tilletia caries]KAE8192171.1 hypothetical protein CF335_g5905 [Tilletia laevis]KAE8243101.1 hypothetical protein A4X06_0g6552 [Tilletia controversa]
MLDTIYIVRHGFRMNWHGNITLGMLGRPRDPVLTAHGLDQAAELATHFLSLPPESRPQLILSSPYYRTVQTSLPTSKALALPIHLEPGLAEWFPPVEASTSDPEGTGGIHPYPPTRDLLEPYFPPDALAPTHAWPPVLYAHPEGEDVPELHARAAQVLRRIERQCELLFPEVRRVLLVSHAATIIAMGRALVCKGPGAPWEQQEGGNAVGYHVGAGTCSLSQYDRRPPSSSASRMRIGDLDPSTAFTHTLNASCDHLASGSEREWNFGHLPHNVTERGMGLDWDDDQAPPKADLDQQQAHWTEQERIMAQHGASSPSSAADKTRL